MSVAFLDADQVASQLGISKAYAYKIIKRLNKELESKGFLTKTTTKNAFIMQIKEMKTNEH